jgi:hypothetical protein
MDADFKLIVRQKFFCYRAFVGDEERRRDVCLGAEVAADLDTLVGRPVDIEG